MRTLRFLLRKEFLQIFRDRTMLFEIVLMPVLQLLILANAATFQLRNVRTVVVDEDHTRSSRGLAQHLAASGRFSIVQTAPTMSLAEASMLRGDAGMIVRTPAGFERELVRTGTGEVQLVFDAEDGATAGIAQAYATRILAAYADELGRRLRPTLATLMGTDAPPRPGVPRLDVRTRGWYNPELDYQHYMVPGILVELVTLIGTLLTAMNIVREKEMGTLEQLNVTPITRGEFIAGKLIPFWMIAMGELALGLVIARVVFHVPMRGSVVLLMGIAAVYLVAALGIGLWISTVAQTQQQAMFVTLFIMLIYLLMSGLFTPVRSMPAWAQWLTEVNPVRHFTEITRAVLLRGAGLRDTWRPFAILVAYAVAVFGIAVRQYSKTSG